MGDLSQFSSGDRSQIAETLTISKARRAGAGVASDAGRPNQSSGRSYRLSRRARQHPSVRTLRADGVESPTCRCVA